MTWELQEVPPPKEVPVDQIAETLGLLDGLSAEKGGRDFWRCARCNDPQLEDSWLVWVPDRAEFCKTKEQIVELCRRTAYNGTGSGWCLSCAPKKDKPKTEAYKRAVGERRRWWQFWK